jgi:pyridoxine kinase
MTDLNGTILSLQSHVVHGYVGNKSAVFPLQLLGFEVDFINSVHFSNHTGYKTFSGERLTGEQLEDLIKGLENNDLLHYSHLLTGRFKLNLNLKVTLVPQVFLKKLFF